MKEKIGIKGKNQGDRSMNKREIGIKSRIVDMMIGIKTVSADLMM